MLAGRGEVRWIVVLGGLVAAAALFLALPATAEEPLSERDYRKRRSGLRSAAGRYITHRKRFPSRCPRCRGTGKMRSRRGRSIVRIDCKQCLGQGVWVSKKDYREVYFDMRSPAFRALPGIKDLLGKQYDVARRGRPWPRHIERYRLSDWELIDATHGIVWFKLNAARAPTATRWVYAASESGGKPRWFLWDERSDGPWPSGRVDPTQGNEPTPDEPGDALTSETARQLRGALARARVTFRVVDQGMRASSLRLTLQPGPDAEDRPPVDRIRVDAVRLARALLDGSQPWRRVEAVWHDHFRDRFGRIVLRPRWLSALDNDRHDATHWDTLGLEAQVRILALSELDYEGWEPVQGSEARPQEPSEPEVPSPPTEQPPRPDPSAPEPTSPTAPTPAPSAPSTAPRDDALPALTSRAGREGRKGVQAIRELLAAATESFNEGQGARRDGAHDLWQEKLAETRTHLEGIKAVWYEDIVPNMPGRDDMERDAVANEHFGAVWDDVSKLESIVRKVSAMR